MTQSIFASIFSRGRLAITGSSSGAGQVSSSLRINSTTNTRGDDEAVKVSLSPSGKAKSGAVEGAGGADASSNRSGGLLRQLLTSIASVTERISQLQSDIVSGKLTQDQQQAYATEVSGLSSEYDRIRTSDSYKQITSITQQVQQSLLGGGSLNGVYSTLPSLRGLLGDDFLSIIRNGDFLRAKTLNDSIGTIGAADSSKFGSEDSVLNDVLAAVHKVFDALNGGASTNTINNGLVIPVIQAPGDTIQATNLTFAGAGDIAISLRSYSTSDMIKLAAAHVDLDPVSVLMLVANPLKRRPGRKDRSKFKQLKRAEVY
jgi:hypothetical protein